jgi:hypothetical protein
MEVLLTCRQRTGWAGGKWTDRVLDGLRLFKMRTGRKVWKTCIAPAEAPGRYRRLKAAGKESRLLKNQEHAF